MGGDSGICGGAVHHIKGTFQRDRFGSGDTRGLDSVGVLVTT